MLTDVIIYFKPTAAFDRPEIIMITPPSDDKNMRQSETVEIPLPQVAERTQPWAPSDNQDRQAQPPSYTPADTNITEREWKEKLQRLEGKIRKYNWTRRGDETAIVEAMRDLAASHNDPQVQAYWARRAREFENAPASDKKAILKDIGRGLVILLAAPAIRHMWCDLDGYWDAPQGIGECIEWQRHESLEVGKRGRRIATVEELVGAPGIITGVLYPHTQQLYCVNYCIRDIAVACSRLLAR
ncbi:hypothetical protein B0H12DRAFT_1068425 [Mycena haematopus]|nr:hypothetical protein B0H12DRAFT_1068425 [Mycena haematopus]